MGSEIAYPHYAFFEWVERGGSYGTLLALWVITGGHSALNYTLTGNHALRKAFVGGAY